MIGICAGLALGSGMLAGVLAAVGCVMGHLVDSRNAALLEDAIDAPPAPLPTSLQAPIKSIQVRDLCSLLIEIARADSAVSRQEMRAIRLWLEDAFPAHLHAVPAFLKAAIAAPNESVAMLCRRLRELPGAPEPELLAALHTLAEADGPLNSAERTALREAAEALGLPEDEPPEEEASFDAVASLAALGLPTGATNEEIKSAYRRLAREHHPDRVSHLGGPAIEAAAARFRTVHEAYEALKRSRGF